MNSIQQTGSSWNFFLLLFLNGFVGLAVFKSVVWALLFPRTELQFSADRTGAEPVFELSPCKVDNQLHVPVFCMFKPTDDVLESLPLSTVSALAAAPHAVNFLGARTRTSFFQGQLQPWHPAGQPPSFPSPADEDYYRFAAVLIAVKHALLRDQQHQHQQQQQQQQQQVGFSVLDVGAGWGRWTVNALLAWKRYSARPYQFVAVEAEPTHCEFVKTHLTDNRVWPVQQQQQQQQPRPLGDVVCQAVHLVDDVVVPFTRGLARTWYGQSVEVGARPRSLSSLPSTGAATGAAAAAKGAEPQRRNETGSDPMQRQWTGSVTLASLLRRFEGPVDLLLIDVGGRTAAGQATEYATVATSFTSIDQRVQGLVVVRTSDQPTHRALRHLFVASAGWIPVFDFMGAVDATNPATATAQRHVTRLPGPAGDHVLFSRGLLVLLNPHQNRAGLLM